MARVARGMSFHAQAIAAAFLFALPSLLAAAPPNILFRFEDDLGRHASAYVRPGVPSPDDLIRTPAFDRPPYQTVE